MANSKLLKEAIADAKAVKETALANAKIALEEAFTPRLQSMLTQKLRAESEMEDDAEEVEDDFDSTDMDSMDLDTDVDNEIEEEEDDMGYPDDDSEITELRRRLAELEGEEDDTSFDDMDTDLEEEEDDTEYSDDDLDLESIIAELEGQLDDTEDDMSDEDDMEFDMPEDDTESDEIDLEEILREMDDEMDGDSVDYSDKDAEIEEAYRTIKSLKRTINEVNLLNAKLLFANKLFRAHNMTNEQKIKVIQTLDRTKSLREVKLVFSTLAENFKYTPSNKTAKRTIREGIASKVIKSTAPKASKQLVSESVQISNRFKKLAGILK
jgi:hypothetical protein